MTFRHLAVLAALAVLPGALHAQQDKAPWSAPRPDPRVVAYVGGAGALAFPVGQFAKYVNLGGGGNLFGAVPLGRGSPVSLRLDGTFLIYGSETRHAPLSTTVQLVTVDVTTSNQIVNLAFGPQVMQRSGRIRPYATGQVGFSYFATVSSVRGSSDAESFATSTNFDDVTFALRGGAGVWIRLSRAPTPVWLDLAATYVRNGQVQYLREGSIAFDIEGTPIYHPIQSETHLWQVTVGLAVGMTPKDFMPRR